MACSVNRPPGPARVWLNCSSCGQRIFRTHWNYQRHRPMTAWYCNFECKAAWQRTQRPVTKEWLHQKYTVEKLDCVAIASIVDRDPKRVWEWLRDDGVDTRKRGMNERVQFKKGHQLGLGRKLSQQTRDKIRAARKQDGRAPYMMPDGSHAMRGRFGADHPRWKGGLTPERQGVQNSQAWKDAVKAVWKRSDARCEKCGLDHRTIVRGTVRFDIHHIITFHYRPTRTDPDNLALLCRPCHMWVHGRKNTSRLFLKEPPVEPSAIVA